MNKDIKEVWEEYAEEYNKLADEMISKGINVNMLDQVIKKAIELHNNK